MYEFIRKIYIANQIRQSFNANENYVKIWKLNALLTQDRTKAFFKELINLNKIYNFIYIYKIIQV